MLLTFALTTGCSDFLEEDPKSVVSPSTILKSVDGFDLTLTGAYRRITGWGGIYSWSAFFCHEGFVPHQYSPISSFSQGDIEARDWQVRRNWERFYGIINSANLVLANIASIDGQPEQDRIEGEAKFLRGWAYFTLVQFFGDVPLILEPVSNPTTHEPFRTDQVEVYDQIISDLKDSATLMDDDAPTPSRVDKWVAKGFLSKAYLTMAGNPNNIDTHEGTSTAQLALNEASDIINSNRYSIDVPYLDVFFLSDDVETIWEVGASDVRLGNAMLHVSQRITTPTDEFIATFDPADVRGPLDGIRTSYEYNGTTETFQRPTYFKFVDVDDFANSNLLQSKLDVTVLRFADILLMAAEAENEVNGGPTSNAYAWINSVRNRAGIADLSGLSYDEFREAVFIERRHELYGEGFGWWDLKRFNKFDLFNNVSRTITTPIDDHLNYYPIYEGELITNPNMTQNPGWGGSN